MSKGSNNVLFLGGAAAVALLLLASSGKATSELQEAAELADGQSKPKPKPKPRPEAVKPKPPQETQAPEAVKPPPQAPSVDVVIGPATMQLPVGYSAASAKAEAPALARHIRAKGASYTRKAVATFQLHAGIASDGIYGPQTASALTYWSGSPAPKPLFKGSVKAYTPPEG